MRTIEKNGKTYALVPMDAWQKLLSGEVEMPELPEADANGDRPALPFMRAIIARGIIRDRVAAGLSQAGLARLAGIEPATLNRIERAKVTPDEATIRKIDKAIKQAIRSRPTQEMIDLRAPSRRVEKAGRLRSATRHKKAG